MTQRASEDYPQFSINEGNITDSGARLELRRLVRQLEEFRIHVNTALNNLGDEYDAHTSHPP